MKKNLFYFALFALFLFTFSVVVYPPDAKAETPTDKGQTAEFYLDMKSKLQSYLQELDNGEITEEQFAEKVRANITPQLKTEEDVDNLIESESKVINTMSLNPYYGFGAFGVKATEIALFAKHPVYSSKAKSLADKALKNAQYRYKDYTLWQGNGDAYRHAYWSALMAKHTTKTFAYEAGYAHEGYKEGSYSKIKDVDVKMDIDNNHSGRDIGYKYRSSSDTYISNKIASSVDNGSLVRIRTYTSGKASQYIDGVPTKYVGHFVATTKGGRIH